MDYGAKVEWSKAQPIRPRDHFVLTPPKTPRFVASYENDPCIAMNWLLGMEYARIWLRERDQFIVKREMKAKPKKIANDYQKWINKRRQPPHRYIC